MPDDFYPKPNLSGHKVLYHTKRYWFFAVDAEHPFDNWQKYYDYVLYDAVFSNVVALANLNENGEYEGAIAHAHVLIKVSGRTPREFVQDYKPKDAWYVKACFG